MKSIINKTLRVAGAVALWVGSGLLQGCNNGDENLKSVDLRYRVEDSYERPAANPEPIVFQVKSSDPWEVTGAAQAEGWYTISPTRGEAGETYDVTITFRENTELDDREDLISIKSDYWTGKQFTIKQIGTAYLTADENVTVASGGGNATISISTNQKWSAAVTSGDEWLSITSAASGELDGKLTLSMGANPGEQRVGEVSIYDRYDRLAWLATCTEEGVVLTPALPAERSWYMLWNKAQSLEVEVESNAEWTVAKSDPTNETWYEISGASSFSGNGKVSINITANTANGVRTGKVKVSTVAAEGVTPVVKYIEFRQAGPAYPVVSANTDFAATALQVLSTECQPGRYDVFIKAIPRMTTEPGPGFDLAWPDYSPDGSQALRVWWRMDGVNIGDATKMRPWPGSYVYTAIVNRWSGWIPNHLLNVGEAYKLSLAYYEYRDADNVGWLCVEWYLNDVLLATLIGDGEQGGAFVGPFASLGSGANLVISAGGFTVEKWQYTPVIDWGEYVPYEYQKYPTEE